MVKSTHRTFSGTNSGLRYSKKCDGSFQSKWPLVLFFFSALFEHFLCSKPCRFPQTIDRKVPHKGKNCTPSSSFVLNADLVGGS